MAERVAGSVAEEMGVKVTNVVAEEVEIVVDAMEHDVEAVREIKELTVMLTVVVAVADTEGERDSKEVIV